MTWSLLVVSHGTGRCCYSARAYLALAEPCSVSPRLAGMMLAWVNCTFPATSTTCAWRCARRSAPPSTATCRWAPSSCSTARSSPPAGNERELRKSPLAHAEMIAIEEAARHMGSWRLLNTVIYVTMEPCPMCAGAIVQARIPHLVYGAPDEKAGAAGTPLQRLPGRAPQPLPRDHQRRAGRRVGGAAARVLPGATLTRSCEAPRRPRRRLYGRGRSRRTVADLMPRLRADLEGLVRLPSVAFRGLLRGAGEAGRRCRGQTC